jgi:tetratricopeptide (TPR) repeat protein
MHRRAAEALEGLHPTSRTAERAHHWMVTAAGGDPDDRRRAAAAAEAAGAKAAERLAPDEACRWYGRALGLRDGDDERTLGDLLLALGAAQRQAGQPAFRDTLLRAARLGHDAGDTELLVAAARLNNRGIQSGLGTVDHERVEVLRWALDAVPADDDGNRAHLLALLALEQLYGLGYDQRAALVAEAVARARKAGEETLLRVLNLVHNAVKSPRSLPERVETTAEALALSDRLGEPVDRYWAIDQRVRTLGEVGDLAEIDRLLDEAEGLARTLARPVLLYMVSMHRTCRAILGGDLDKAESWAEATHQVGIDSGQPEARAMFGAHLLRIRREQGRGEEVIDLLEAVAAANETLAALRGSLANLHAVSGDRDRAVELLRAQDALGYESIHEDNLWVSAMAEWGEAAAAVGDTDAAASILELVTPFRGVHVHNGATGAGPVDRVVGLLLGTLGRTEEAVAAFVAAENQARAAGLPIYEAHALVGRARLLAASGDPAAALALTANAIAIAEPLGAGLAVREAKAVARGAG